jgi:hypothetical protein
VILTPTCCPVCGGTTVERILPSLEVLVRDTEPHEVGGLYSYRCLAGGHIFFVRAADLESEAQAVAAMHPPHM